MSGREDRDPPEDRGAEVTVELPEVSRDNTRLLDDVASVLPSTTTETGTSSIRKRELLPGWRLVVNFRDDLGGDHSGRLMRTTGLSSLPTVTNMRSNFLNTRRCKCLPLVKMKPQVGSIEFSRG